MVKGICKNCLYFQKQQQMIVGQDSGECHRYPPTGFPVPSTQGLQIMSIFPPTKATNSCGEFQNTGRIRHYAKHWEILAKVVGGRLHYGKKIQP
jgi:hypothetical protein